MESKIIAVVALIISCCSVAVTVYIHIQQQNKIKRERKLSLFKLIAEPRSEQCENMRLILQITEQFSEKKDLGPAKRKMVLDAIAKFTQFEKEMVNLSKCVEDISDTKITDQRIEKIEIEITDQISVAQVIREELLNAERLMVSTLKHPDEIKEK